MAEIVTTAGYSPEEQAAYCANYCAGEHHPACALGDERQHLPHRGGEWLPAQGPATCRPCERCQATGWDPETVPGPSGPIPLTCEACNGDGCQAIAEEGRMKP